MGLVGKTLGGRFRVEALVHEGRLRAVFRAMDLETDLPAAVTCLHLPDSLDPALAAPIADAFEAGCRLHRTISLATPHVPDVLACGPRTPEADPRGLGASYLACSWLDGEPLAADLARRREEKCAGRSVVEALDLLEGAASGLAAANARGIAHLSVRPGAIFLTKGAGGTSSRLLDLGLARALDDAELTVQGATAARARYEAPEQRHRILGEPGPATDVYALALVLLEVLSDRPFLAATDPLDSGHRPSPWTHGLRLAGAIERVLDRALALNPKRRYPDVGAFWSAARNAVAASKVFHLRPGVTSARERSGLADRLRSWGRERRVAGVDPSARAGAARASASVLGTVRKSSKPPTLGASRPPQYSLDESGSLRPATLSRRPTDPQRLGAWSSPPLTIPQGPPLPYFGEELERFQSEFPLGVGRGPFWSAADSSIPPREDLDEPSSPTLGPTVPLDELDELAVPGSLHPPPPSSRASIADALSSPPPSVDSTPDLLEDEPGRDPSRDPLTAFSPAGPSASPPPHSSGVRARHGLAFVGLLGAVAIAAITVGSRPRPSVTAQQAPAFGPPPFDPVVAAHALERASAHLAECSRAEGPHGKAEVVVELGPDGHVAKVVLGAPFRGTPVGECIGHQVEQADMGAFEGAPRMVLHRVEIPTPAR